MSKSDVYRCHILTKASGAFLQIATQHFRNSPSMYEASLNKMAITVVSMLFFILSFYWNSLGQSSAITLHLV